MIVNLKGTVPPDTTSKFFYIKDNKDFYIVSKKFSKTLWSCKKEKLSNIFSIIFKVKLKNLLMLLESLFSNKISLINDNHIAIAIFSYFDKTKTRNWSSKRAYICAQSFCNKTVYPYMYFCATFFTQKVFGIRYFLHIITTVYSLLNLVHNFSLSVLLSAKEHP